MYKVCLVLVLFASVYSESQVRETETWMPMKTTQPAEVTQDDIAGSGASTTAGHSDDFGFTDDNEDEDEEDYDTYGEEFFEDEDDEDYEDEEMSGSGDGVPTVTINNDNTHPSSNPNIHENKIPELEVPFRPRPTVNDIDLVRNRNEVLVRAEPPQQEEHPSNVLMSHAGSEGLFNKTEILAVIVGGAVTLLCAVLLIVFLIYRMRKKDEGSYDLGKKPIYKKAPTTEIYA
ncbi:syndecan-4 isoform X3 [Osmerus mordax]|uniref:syndecan-4 isoform X3 n=1 Tax=Osmerus mordax TaxID=8014 RepID=UPI00350FA0D6